MSLNLIFIIAIFLSLVGVGLLVFRKLPILANLSEEEIMILSRKKSLWQKIKEVDYKQYWSSWLNSFEKLLRKLKIWSLRVENLLNSLISFLRRHSQMATQRSKEWIRQKEDKRRKSFDQKETKKKIKTEKDFSVKIEKEDKEEKPVLEKKQAPNDFIASKINTEQEQEDEDDDLPINELKKPIKEEQKWIDLIVENPKNITAYKQLGLLYWRQHNYKDAKLSLEMAVKLGSTDKKIKQILEQIKQINKQ